MKKTFYITTSIAYTNALPHLGFTLELVQADVIARCHRLLGEDVFFLTGTDEHGTKIEKTARKKKITPKKFCNEISNEYRKLKKLLNLSNDDFIQTTDQERHWPTVEKVWKQLEKNKDIYKKKYKGLYCSGCESFISKKELQNGKCLIHNLKAEEVQEENYFFRLSKYSKQIKKALEENKVKIIPTNRKKEMLNFIKEGLKDISFSRSKKSLTWGIPVPNDKNQVIYCWADALTNYISAIGYLKGGDKFKKYWPADVQCIGKDIQKFHCLIWLGILFSLKISLPKKIFIHGFITADKKKMSKSLGNCISPFDLVNKYGIDPLRYYLLREISPTEDGDFSYKRFEERYNADLAKGLGNLVSRIITIADGQKFKTGKKEINNNISWGKYKKALEEFKFNEALVSIWELIGECDRYIERKKPWEKSKNQKTIIYNLLCSLSEIALMLKPFLPDTSKQIFIQLGETLKSKKQEFNPKKGNPLFPRI